MEISTFSSCALVEGRLLRAVIGLAAGILDEKSERREKGDGVDVRAGFGSRKKLCVFVQEGGQDRKSTRLNSSHRCISYAVFCLKKKRHLRHPIRNRPVHQKEVKNRFR